MPNEQKFIELNVETFILVAVWEKPFIFQGCFKVTELNKEETVLYFFRCTSSYEQQIDLLSNDFSENEYKFTHLYNESSSIGLNKFNSVQEDALYLLKYALHVTLKTMLTTRKLHFTTIDDVAVQALIKRVAPILNEELKLPEEEHIGFAVAMDFCPKEEIALAAALTLLSQFKNNRELH